MTINRKTQEQLVALETMLSRSFVPQERLSEQEIRDKLAIIRLNRKEFKIEVTILPQEKCCELEELLNFFLLINENYRLAYYKKFHKSFAECTEEMERNIIPKFLLWQLKEVLLCSKSGSNEFEMATKGVVLIESYLAGKNPSQEEWDTLPHKDLCKTICTFYDGKGYPVADQDFETSTHATMMIMKAYVWGRGKRVSPVHDSFYDRDLKPKSIILRLKMMQELLLNIMTERS